jgi:riboflavin biosynthesis pyrimidine reductase
MRVVWYTAMSMDGRIADATGSLDFLTTIEPRDDALAPFPAFLRTIDAVVVGATTLRWLLDGGHGWPHGDLATWLVSHDATLLERVGPTAAPLRRFEGDLATLFAEIEAGGHERVWLCGGGIVAGQALAAGRIDEVIVTVAPAVLGQGPSLFDAPSLPPCRFALADVAPVAGNAVRLHWLAIRS